MDHSTHEEVVEALANAREVIGVTQARMGSLLVVKPSTIKKWETGETCPSNDHVYIICGLANYSAAETNEMIAIVRRDRASRARDKRKGVKAKAGGDRRVRPRSRSRLPSASTHYKIPLDGCTGDAIRYIRENLGLSNAKFADAIGVCKSTVDRWEQIDRPPGHESVLRIAEMARLDDVQTEGLVHAIDRKRVRRPLLSNKKSTRLSRELEDIRASLSLDHIGFAEALDCSFETVRGWELRGIIPKRHHLASVARLANFDEFESAKLCSYADEARESKSGSIHHEERLVPILGVISQDEMNAIKIGDTVIFREWVNGVPGECEKDKVVDYNRRMQHQNDVGITQSLTGERVTVLVRTERGHMLMREEITSVIACKQAK